MGDRHLLCSHHFLAHIEEYSGCFHMPFSHHSHSGQFCHHAVDSLDEMVQGAIAKGMSTYCLTEHMPREAQDLYPEELEIGQMFSECDIAQRTSTHLLQLFEEYVRTARDLQTMYKSQINIAVGMEIDWIRHSSQAWIQNLLSTYQLDLWIGSVHHVHTVPIDYSVELFKDALEKSCGSYEKLCEDYFDSQYDMLYALRPPIVGHFDLIRLKSDKPNASFKAFPKVWTKILRNLDYVIKYKGVIEINTAALRKGLDEPFPAADICQEVITRGGSFTISDDAHGVNQVGTNYDKLWTFLEKASIDKLVCWQDGMEQCDQALLNPRFKHLDLCELKSHRLFLPTNAD